MRRALLEVYESNFDMEELNKRVSQLPCPKDITSISMRCSDHVGVFPSKYICDMLPNVNHIFIHRKGSKGSLIISKHIAKWKKLTRLFIFEETASIVSLPQTMTTLNLICMQ